MENKFKKGLILGGLLAAGAAALGIMFTKEGGQLTDDLQKDLKTLIKHLRKNLGDMQDVTRESFDEAVTRVVDEYAAKKELALDTKKALVTALRSKWEEMEEEYLSDKEADEKEEKKSKK